MPRFRLALVLLAIACGGSGTEPPPPPPPNTSNYIDASANLPAVTSSGNKMEARAADFDRDGDMDILLAIEFRFPALLINDGTGRFTDASDRLPRVARDWEDIAVADLDRDGDLDAIIVAEDDSSKMFVLGDGSGGFTDVSSRLARRCVSNAVAAGDIDRDGDLDIIYGCGGPEWVLINDGAGNFADESAARIAPSVDITQDVALGDLDGDGDLDLVLGNENGNLLYINNGSGVFVPPAANALPLVVGEETRNADLGDVDGDGDLDLFFSNTAWRQGNAPQDRLLLNDGSARFTDATAGRVPADVLTTLDAELADLDGDGDRDLVLAFWPEVSHRVYLNDGTGRFTDATADNLPSTAVGPGVEVEVADFNGDGKPDLYLTAFNGADRLYLRR